MKRVIAVASFGGHWIQLRRLSRVLSEHDTTYISTNRRLSETIGMGEKFICVPEASADSKLRMVMLFISALFITLRLRPSVVLSTGAAPGLAFLIWGRLMGAKTIWIDSIANAEEMSRSGLIARRWATVWMCQWPEVAEKSGAEYSGSVL